MVLSQRTLLSQSGQALKMGSKSRGFGALRVWAAGHREIGQRIGLWMLVLHTQILSRSVRLSGLIK